MFASPGFEAKLFKEFEVLSLFIVESLLSSQDFFDYSLSGI
jgi:hypothetical protein